MLSDLTQMFRLSQDFCYKMTGITQFSWDNARQPFGYPK